jgi:PAS domain S-box-containing protein
MKPVTGHLLKVGLFVLLATVITLIVVLIIQSKRMATSGSQVSHTKEVLYHSEQIRSTTLANQLLISDFLNTREKQYRPMLFAAGDSLMNAINRLRMLTADNARQQSRIRLLQYYAAQSIQAAKEITGNTVNLPLQSVQKKYADSVFAAVLAVETAEQKLLANREDMQQYSVSRLNTMLAWLIIVLLVLLAVAIQKVRFDFLAFKSSERKRSEAELELSLLLNNVKEYAIFTTDINGYITSWNEGSARVKGYQQQEIMGRHIAAFYPADKVASGEPQQNLHKAIEYGNYETEGWRVRKDGTIFWANNVFTALYDHQDNLRGFAEITRDNTEQQKKKEEISYLSNLVAQTSDAIISTDTNFIIKSWNAAAEKLYGYTGKQAIGQHSGRLINSRMTEEQRANAVEELHSKGFYRYETAFDSKNGDIIYVLSSVTTITRADGQMAGYVSVHRDITDRKKLEARLISFNEQLEEKVKNKTAELTDVFERVTDAFVAFDRDWRYTYVNKQAALLFNKLPEDLVGKIIWEEFPVTINTELYPLFHRAYSEQKFCSNSGYFSPLGLWLENYVYPSPDGISVFIKNISDRKKAEEEVSRSNERFQIVANATNDVVWDWDLVNEHVWWNKNYYTHLGYNMQDSHHTSSWYNGIHPDDRTRVTEGIRNAIDTGEPFWSDEYRFLKADGQVVYMLDRGYIMYDKENKPYRMAGAMVDVTSMRKAEETIINNEKRFRALLKNSTDGLMLMDAAGVVLDISPSGSAIFGYAQDELVGHIRKDLVHPDDAGAMEEAFSVIVSRPGEISLHEYRHRMPNNSYRWIEFSYNNLLHEPYVNAVVLNFRDITERKLAEEKVRTNEQTLMRAQEIGQFGSWEFDATTRTVQWSDTMYRIHGLSRQHPVTLATFFTKVHPDDIVKIRDVFKNLRPSETRFRDEYRIVTDRGLRYALTTIDAVFENGQLSRAMGVAQDITEQKLAEEVLRQSEARYRKAQAQGRLGHWELNIRTASLFLSDEIYSIFNLQPGCLSEGMPAFLHIIHPDDRALFTAALQAAVKGETMNIIHRIVCKDGRIQYIHEIAELEKTPDGKPLRLTGMAQDITQQQVADEQLRRSEHKYRLLFENNPMPMWMSAIPDLNIIDVNESALKQYGYSREEFLQLNSRDLRPPEDMEIFLKEANDRAPGPFSTMQWRHQKKDGTIIYVEIFNYQIIYENKPVWLGLSVDITEKTRAEKLLKKSYEDIRQLASHLQDIREEERASMAREIHDELGQQLTGLKMDISWLGRKKDLSQPERDQKIKEILNFLDGTVNTVRKLSSELRPSILDDLGIVEALEWWSAEFEKRSGVTCVFVPPTEEIQVSSAIAIGLFRIYQESLTNVARHAGASHVAAQLIIHDKALVLQIADNGKGFDTSNAGKKKTLGLLGMRERTLMMGGSYEISSCPGKGTTVTISVPF